MLFNTYLFIQRFPLSPIKMYLKKKRRKKRPIFGETSLCRGCFILKWIQVILSSVVSLIRLRDEIKMQIAPIDKQRYLKNIKHLLINIYFQVNYYIDELMRRKKPLNIFDLQLGLNFFTCSAPSADHVWTIDTI